MYALDVCMTEVFNCFEVSQQEFLQVGHKNNTLKGHKGTEESSSGIKYACSSIVTMYITLFFTYFVTEL